jgi:ERCC4-type nuclease
MIIKIDMREHELLKKCQQTLEMVPNFKNLVIQTENLPLGDIIINDGTTDTLIIERKSLTDLAASIKDGRYEEQSYRLNGIPHHNHNIIYLIEGDLTKFNTFKERVDKQTLYSAMFSINYFKGFSLMRSNSIEETAMIVCNMAHKIGKDKSRNGYYANEMVTENVTTSADVSINEEGNIGDGANNSANNVLQNTAKNYCSVVKKVKKDNITVENIGEIMLCQIPGISSTTAIAILAQFKTIPNLIKSIQEDETCLDTICTLDSNNKARKISKTAISSIIKFLKA